MSWGAPSVRVAAATAAFLALVSAANAATDERCEIPAIFVEPLSPLPRAAAAARRDRKLDILVLSGSPSQTGAAKGLRSYPAYFQDALREKFPSLEVHVAISAAPRRSVADLVPQLDKVLADARPSLVIWQAGTADAYRGLEAESFAEALRRGLSKVLESGADVVLMDMQYSPRTDNLVDVGGYIANMRWITSSMEVPLFSRYEIMRHWNDTGAFDLGSLRNNGLFEQVHRCIGELLADFVARGAELKEFESKER